MMSVTSSPLTSFADPRTSSASPLEPPSFSPYDLDNILPYSTFNVLHYHRNNIFKQQ